MRRIDDIDVTLLERKFHWPSDADQIWRHFTDYFLTDKKGKLIEDMLFEEGSYRAQGTLLARPGSNHPSIENVEITFSTYAIDFGKSLHDAGRGYWVKGILDNGEDVWYKMEKSSSQYEKYSAQMNNKVDNFLLLHDTLTKGNYEFVTTHPYTQLVSCKLTISEFHRRTNGAFNFKFVQENCEFVLDHLKNNLDPEKSLNFLLSIVSLGGIKRKLFLALFPSLKANYIKSDSKKNDVPVGKDFEMNNSTRHRIGKRKEIRESSSLSSEYDDTKSSRKFESEGSPSSFRGDRTLNPHHHNSHKMQKIQSVSHDTTERREFVDKTKNQQSTLDDTPLLTKVQWLDTMPHKKLFVQHDINYDETFDLEIKGRGVTFRSIFKSKPIT